MAGVQARGFDAPDETRTPDKTRVEVVRLGAAPPPRASRSIPVGSGRSAVKPVVGTETCQVRHVGLIQAGRMHVDHDDGSEVEIGPGDAYVIEPGHDAWVVGGDGVIAFEFESKTAEDYAKGD
jgi:hypothetical protein